MDESTDSVGSRISGHRYRSWIVLRANRWLLSAVVLLGVFGLLVGTSQLGLTPFRDIAADRDGFQLLFTAFIGAIITGTSIVVTINQLVLSQELGAVGDQRSRMRESVEFRADIEDRLTTTTVSPEPAAFLTELTEGIRTNAETLHESVDENTELAAALDDYVDRLQTTTDQVTTNLSSAQFGTFDVLWAVLDFNYSEQIYQLRRIQHDHAAECSAETEEAVEELLTLLKLFGPAREHFKTLYFQWELISLSRSLLYISVPALAVIGGLIMYVDSAALTGTVLGIDSLVWVASGGFTVGIAPFVVFTVFIVRIASVAKRTLAMGPFILQETDREIGDA